MHTVFIHYGSVHSVPHGYLLYWSVNLKLCNQKWLGCIILSLRVCVYFSAVFHQRSVTWWWVRCPPSASLPSPYGPQPEVSATHTHTHCHSHPRSPAAALVLCVHADHNRCKEAESVFLYSEVSLTKQTAVCSAQFTHIMFKWLKITCLLLSSTVFFCGIADLLMLIHSIFSCFAHWSAFVMFHD